jgi:hypothetical protein
MGMYTEIVLAVGLKRETPEDVRAILRGEVMEDLPFDAMMLYGWSAYFPAVPSTKLYEGEDAPQLSVRACYRAGRDVSAFLDWLSPWVDDPYRNGFCGYTRYEENEDRPSSYIVMREGQLVEESTFPKEANGE